MLGNGRYQVAPELIRQGHVLTAPSRETSAHPKDSFSIGRFYRSFSTANLPNTDQFPCR